MHVVKTFAEKAAFNSGQQFVRGVNNNFDSTHHSNSDIRNGLRGELGDEFDLWAEATIARPSQVDRIRYENFIMGYIYRHDLLVDSSGNKEPDHSVYFKWDQPQQGGDLSVRVFLSPILVPLPVSKLDPEGSLIGNASADTTDPPSSTTPPPPLNGVAQ